MYMPLVDDKGVVTAVLLLYKLRLNKEASPSPLHTALGIHASTLAAFMQEVSRIRMCIDMYTSL